MTKTSKPPASTTISATEPGKRPYKKPAYTYDQIFETMALACGKISGTQGACNQVRKLS